MQSHAPPRKKSSFGVVLLVLFLFGTLLLGGLLLLGVGAWVFARSEAQQSRAMAVHERAQARVEQMHREMEAQREATEHQREVLEESIMQMEKRRSGRESEAIPIASREITLQLDADGNLQADGEPLEKDRLKPFLRDAVKGRESALTVTVKADPRCMFSHVAEVLSICQDVDVANIRVAARDQ